MDGWWCDEDLAGWYPRDGRRGLSPAQLATICVLQFLLDLSDRQAAEAIRCRTDSTHVLTAVRGMTRLELITEAVRGALEELARTAAHLLTGLVTRTWGAATAVRSAWARTPPGRSTGRSTGAQQ